MRRTPTSFGLRKRHYPPHNKWFLPIAAAVAVAVTGFLWAAEAVYYKYIYNPFPVRIENVVWKQIPAASPDFSFVDGTGQPVKLSDFRGKPVLLNFWATWCVPCVAEMQDFDEIQAQYGDQMKIVAISQDRTPFKIEEFYQEQGLEHLDIYWDSQLRGALAFRYEGLPTSYLISPDGQILGSVRGAAEFSALPEAHPE